MIIDLILDRKDGEEYNARDFYYACLHYGEVGDDITRALDSGTEKDVKKALCDYVIDNDYNKNICKYINSVNWLDDDYYESKKSVRKSLKEKVTVTKSLKIIEHALLDLIHDDTIQEEFNMAFDDVGGIYDSVDDMFEVSVHNVLNKLLKEHTITVLPF